MTAFSLNKSTSNAHPHLSIFSKVSVNGIDSILIGMTIEEAEAVSGVKLLLPYPEESYVVDFCRYYYPEIDVEGISFMVWNGKIARIDINNRVTSTISGVKVGDTIERIKSVYSQQIKVSPGHYGGKYLIYEPQDQAYKDYLLLFQAYQGVVHDFRVGYKYHVKNLVEGCS